MLGCGVVPRFTQPARKRKSLFFKGWGVHFSVFLGIFLAFPVGYVPT